MKAALLPDRGVVKVAGDDARKFLNGLVTSDIAKVTPAAAGFSALLTPQGKIIVDFILAEAPPADGGGFFLDCPRALASTLVQRLNFYKLRAKLIVEDLSETLGVLAIWDGGATTEYGLCYRDPRLPALGLRCMLPPHLAGEAAADVGAELVEPSSYEAHRIALGVPRGGLDFIYGDAFPHETDMDQFGGVDFDKGCFVSTAPPTRWPRGSRSSPAASKCAWSSPLGRNSHGPARRRQRNEPSPPPPRRPQTLSLAEAGPALRRLSRPGMGRAEIRRPRALREAHSRRLPGRAVLDHHPAQARQFPPRLRRLRARENRALHAEKDREADAGCRHRAQPHEDRGRGPLRARLSRRDGERPRLLAAAVGLRRRQAEGQSLPLHVPGAGGNAGFAGDVEGAGEARLQIRRSEHRLCLHAGDRHGQRSRSELLPARGLGRAGGPLSAMPAKPRPAISSEPFRAWQRMLSGRRLDLLDPSPLDVEIADIAHGLARVARWNGQTEGAHIFSVAQHSLLVETIARQRTRLDRASRLGVLLHDAPEYVIGDMISPFKAVIGDAYKAVEGRLLAAIHLRFGLPAVLPADLAAVIKASDRCAAYLEATRLAGFSASEARRFFGAPPKFSAVIERDYLVPWPAETAERRYLDRFAKLAGG